MDSSEPIESTQRRFTDQLEPIRDLLVAFARQLAWSPNDWEDILQAALTTAFTFFSNYQEGTNFRAWMFRHLQNAAWNHNRRRRPASLSGDQGDLLVFPEVETSGHEREKSYQALLDDPEVLYDHFDERVRTALLSLNETERTILLFRSIADFSYKEMADIMEIPIGTVMACLCHAREKMRCRLAAHIGDMGWNAKKAGGSP